MPKLLAHFEANRLRVNPTAIGRMHPDFLLRAQSQPPKKIGAASNGQRPAKTKLTKAVKAVRKYEPASRQSSKSRMICGLRPSGPPAEPAGNERTARRTSDSSTDRLWTGEEGGRSSALTVPCGCFSCSLAKESLEGSTSKGAPLLSHYHPQVWQLPLGSAGNP